MPTPVPDLLCAEARLRIDPATLRQALVFAFAAGGSLDVFDDVLAVAALPSSSWSAAAFARDLFLDEVVRSCLSVRVSGKTYSTCTRYLTRVIGGPPSDSRDVELRRMVLDELSTRAEARAELEAVYLAIVRLRGLLCAPRQPAPRVRRVEILRAVRELFELLARSFQGATSALGRLRDFGAAVRAGPAFGRLAALLDHDEQQASLDLRVRVGADGEVRTMDLVRVHEDRKNPFYVSMVRRLLVRLVLFLRGYRVTAGGVVERLLSDVLAGLEDDLTLVFQMLGDVELYLGALCFRDRASERGLAVTLPRAGGVGDAFEATGLFNPLLLAALPQPVSCDLGVRSGAIVLVTGPNSGGKTRLLQAIGTAQLLADAGLFVPARSATMPRASGLFASLFEESRADQPEGHLGMELLRIRRLFDEMAPGGLVVLDELCSGTNPSEGEEIARLVLSLLPELGVRAFVTTHLLKFAQGLSRDSAAASLDFLQVELDAEERPTYRFRPGVAHTSLAHKTAARLGVTREEILERIREKRARGS
jgi:DNA mismatch repair protein MutS2